MGDGKELVKSDFNSRGNTRSGQSGDSQVGSSAQQLVSDTRRVDAVALTLDNPDQIGREIAGAHDRLSGGVDQPSDALSALETLDYQESVRILKEDKREMATSQVGNCDFETFVTNNTEKYPKVTDKAWIDTVKGLQNIVRPQVSGTIDSFIDSVVKKAEDSGLSKKKIKHLVDNFSFQLQRDNDTGFPGTYSFLDPTQFSMDDPDKDLCFKQEDGTRWQYESPLDSATIESALQDTLHFERQITEEQAETSSMESIGPPNETSTT